MSGFVYEDVAKEILNQLGGNRFIAMTGVSEFMIIENGLRMKIPKNKSKANRLYIRLNINDTYDMEFVKFKNMTISRDMSEDLVSEIKDVYFDKLQEIFTEVTGMYTSL